MCGHSNERITVCVSVYVYIHDWSVKKPSNLVCEKKKTIYAPDFVCSFSIQSMTA